MLHWGGDPGGIDSLCKDLPECPRPYLPLLLSHLWLGPRRLYLGDLVKKDDLFMRFLSFSHVIWQSLLFSIVVEKNRIPFSHSILYKKGYFVFVCFVILPTSRPSSSWAIAWTNDCLKVSNALRDWATFRFRRWVFLMPCLMPRLNPRLRQVKIDPHWNQGMKGGELWGMLTFIMKKTIL